MPTDNRLTFAAEWYSLVPSRMTRALNQQTSCVNPRCKHVFAIGQGFNASATRVNCPECRRCNLLIKDYRAPNNKTCCQGCKAEAVTRYCTFHQNIGMVLLRRQSEISGNMCRDCIDRAFWRTTSTTIAIGWLGVVSLIVSPFLVISNLYTYAKTLRMPPPPPHARQPDFSERTFNKALPHCTEAVAILEERNDKELAKAFIADEARIRTVEAEFALSVFVSELVLNDARTHAKPAAS